MEKYRKILLTLFAALTAVGVIGMAGRVIALCRALPGFLWMPGRAASIGIIGGADGPTAVFVTSKTGIPWWGFFLLVLFGVAGLLWLRKTRKEE